MFRINERKASLGQKGVIRRYLSQLLGSSSKRLKASNKSCFLHFIVFFFMLMCLFFAVLWGIKFLKILVDCYYALGSVA